MNLKYIYLYIITYYSIYSHYEFGENIFNEIIIIIHILSINYIYDIAIYYQLIIIYIITISYSLFYKEFLLVF